MKSYKKSIYTLGLLLILSISLVQVAHAATDIEDENDVYTGADELFSDDYIFGTSDDDDWYNITVNEGEMLDIGLFFDNMIADIGIELYDIDGSSLIRFSDGDSSEEYINWYCDFTGVYYILVYQSLSYVSCDYELAVCITEDDIYENNDYVDEAPEIPRSETHEGLVLFDTDCFNVSLWEGANFSVEIEYDYYSEYIEVSILDNLGDECYYFKDDDVDGFISVILEDIPTTEIYTMAIYSLDYYYEYNLTTSMTYFDDDFEHNDDIDEAADIAPGIDYEGLVYLDADCYNISLWAGANLTVDIEYDYVDEDMAIYSCDPSGNLIGIIDDDDNDGFVSLFIENLLESGEYTIVIESLVPYREYNLSTTLEDEDDEYENNDDPTEATEIGYGISYEGLMLLDIDCYNISLWEESDISVTIEYEYDEEDIMVSLGDPMGNFLPAYGDDNDDGLIEILVENIPSTGIYTMVIFSNQVYESYNFTTSMLYMDDGFEQNDYIEEAQDIAPGLVYEGLVLLDADCYNISLVAGANFTVDIEYDYVDEDMEIYLGDPSGNVIASADDDDNDGFVSIFVENLLESGEYTIVIGSMTPYMEYNLSTTLEVEDDEHEDNDILSDATWISSGVNYDYLVLIDEDYYNITLWAGANLTIDIKYDYIDEDILGLVVDPLGNIYASFDDDNNDGQISLFLEDVLYTGMYSIGIASNSLYKEYNLTVTIEDEDDWYEENDNLEEAEEIFMNYCFEDFVLIDLDVFNISLWEGANFTLEIEFESGDAIIMVSIYDQNGNELGSSYDDVDGLISLSIENLAYSGNYTIFVFPIIICEAYNLTTIMDYEDDVYEDQEILSDEGDPISGANLGDGLYENLVFLDDFECFNVTLGVGENITIEIGNDFDISGEIYLVRPDQAEEPYYSSTGELTLTNIDLAGSWLIVICFDDDVSCYDLDIAITPVPVEEPSSPSSTSSSTSSSTTNTDDGNGIAGFPVGLMIVCAIAGLLFVGRKYRNYSRIN